MPEPLTDEELAFLSGVLDLAREGRTEELADVIRRGVPVNLTGGAGDSLLMLAAYHEHPPTVRMLLEHGADTERVNDRGQTALGRRCSGALRSRSRSCSPTAPTPTRAGAPRGRSRRSSASTRWPPCWRASRR